MSKSFAWGISGRQSLLEIDCKSTTGCVRAPWISWFVLRNVTDDLRWSRLEIVCNWSSLTAVKQIKCDHAWCGLERSGSRFITWMQLMTDPFFVWRLRGRDRGINSVCRWTDSVFWSLSVHVAGFRSFFAMRPAHWFEGASNVVREKKAQTVTVSVLPFSFVWCCRLQEAFALRIWVWMSDRFRASGPGCKAGSSRCRRWCCPLRQLSGDLILRAAVDEGKGQAMPQDVDAQEKVHATDDYSLSQKPWWE